MAGKIKGLAVSGVTALVERRGSAKGESSALRHARSGALAAVLALGAGAFFLLDPGAKDRAWASLPRPSAAPTKTAVIQITPAQAVERGVQPSALVAARPFQFTALNATSSQRAEKCLAEAVYYEAGSESEDGQRAVAQVVLNRVRHAAFPHSVCGVVYQGAERSTGCQFTFTCDGSLARIPNRFGWRRAMEVAGRALGGEVYGPVGHATHYHAAWMTPYWAPSVAMVGRIGGHIFYSWKGAAGSAAAFSQAYAGIESLKQPAMQPAASGDETGVEIADTGPSLENPALTGKVRGIEALQDPGNADLLNYKAAGAGSAAARPDEAEVEKAIASAL